MLPRASKASLRLLSAAPTRGSEPTQRPALSARRKATVNRSNASARACWPRSMSAWPTSASRRTGPCLPAAFRSGQEILSASTGTNRGCLRPPHGRREQSDRDHRRLDGDAQRAENLVREQAGNIARPFNSLQEDGDGSTSSHVERSS